jgi:hypothetical protein
MTTPSVAAPEAPLDDSTAPPADWKDQLLTTDGSGAARVAIDRSGLWNLRTLHAAPTTPDGPHEWEVAFAPIVFRAVDAGGHARVGLPRVAQSGGEVTLNATSQARGDSAGVAAVVHRFHAAIAAGIAGPPSPC